MRSFGPRQNSGQLIQTIQEQRTIQERAKICARVFDFHDFHLYLFYEVVYFFKPGVPISEVS